MINHINRIEKHEKNNCRHAEIKIGAQVNNTTKYSYLVILVIEYLESKNYINKSLPWSPRVQKMPVVAYSIELSISVVILTLVYLSLSRYLLSGIWNLKCFAIMVFTAAHKTCMIETYFKTGVLVNKKWQCSQHLCLNSFREHFPDLRHQSKIFKCAWRLC